LKGHRYIILAFDYLPKWVDAIPLKDVKQKSVIYFIEEHITCQFRIPETLTTYEVMIYIE